MAPVILAGGGGTRLWPLSREHYPKQFLSFGGDGSLLQRTLVRFGPATTGLPGTDVQPATVICNQEHRFLVAAQAQQAGVERCRIMLEPVGRNTAPALTLAALLQQEPDSVLILMPADHVIDTATGFYDAITAAVGLAAEDYLVTLGIQATRPETGFGYIRRGGAIVGHEGAALVAEFTEKPDQVTAEQFLSDGGYAWNSGIFIVRAGVWLRAVEALAPEMLSSCRAAYEQRTEDLDFLRLDEAAFAACPSDSIDYAVMEKLDRLPDLKAAVVSADINWSDVGSWNGYWEIMDQDGNGNVISGDCLPLDVCDSVISSERRLVTAVGVSNLVIVETADAVLVAHRSRSQDVKELVSVMKSAERDEVLHHRRVFRPWGSYEPIDGGDGFQVKRLTIDPGQRISLQKHHHRAEHWVVVDGVAEVTRDEDVFTLKPNQSTDIPVGAVHRLANPGDTPLQVIEVQSGDYLGEDDIVRYEDVYNRK